MDANVFVLFYNIMKQSKENWQYCLLPLPFTQSIFHIFRQVPDTSAALLLAHYRAYLLLCKSYWKRLLSHNDFKYNVWLQTPCIPLISAVDCKYKHKQCCCCFYQLSLNCWSRTWYFYPSHRPVGNCDHDRQINSRCATTSQNGSLDHKMLTFGACDHRY